MKEIFLNAIDNAAEAINKLREPQAIEFMEQAAKAIAECFRKGNKLIIAGNGGSLCDAMHFAEELTGYFRRPRKALPAIALSEPGHITCTGNDAGFEWIFARGVEAYGKPGDIFIALTTSGNSKNLIQAVKTAKEMDLFTINFLGKDGGKLRGTGDLELIIEGFATSDRIQEAHMAAIHMIIEGVEHLLFARKKISQILMN